MKIPQSVVQFIEELCEQRTFSNESLRKSSAAYNNIVDHNIQFLSKTDKEGLSQKSKVLMILGHYAICGTDQEIEWGVSAAVYVGVSEKEMANTLEFALLTGGGGAVSRVQLANTIHQYRLAVGNKTERFQFNAQIS